MREYVAREVVAHYCGCISEDCVCWEEDWKKEDKEIVLKLQTAKKQDSLRHNLNFQKVYEFAMFNILNVNFSTKGLLGLYLIKPTGIIERYRRYKVINLYKSNMEFHMKTKNLVNPIEIEQSFENYEEFRKVMGTSVQTLK